jgi:hypothetical protein
MAKKEKGESVIISSLKAFRDALYPAYRDDGHDRGALLQDNPLAHGRLHGITDNSDPDNEAETLNQGVLPSERAERYSCFAKMAQDPLIDEAINMHLTFALTPDKRTGHIFEINSTAKEYDDLISDLRSELLPLINKDLVSWAYVMCVYGTSYVRPYAKEGRGITHFESSYYTLPHFVREYVRSGLPAGFTNQYLRDKDRRAAVELAPPWSLVSFKVPYFSLDPTVEPLNFSGQQYSLMDEYLDQSIVESQNYGHSFLEHSFEPYRDLIDAVDSMRGSRRNASRIDRLMLVPMESLDPMQAAEYSNYISAQLKANKEAEDRWSFLRRNRPLITNSLIPVHGGSKGQMTIDTQRIDPNISDIEDILFHLKRLASSLGVDASMLGWADMLSGGLGEGGFFQTSIQATRRANWVRHACTEAINRMIDLHLWYRYKKIFPKGTERPWTINFNSLNTAIAESENDARESQAAQSTMIAQLIDAISSGATKKSPELVEQLLGGVLPMDKEIIKKIAKAITEPSKEESEGFGGGQDDLMSSFTNIDQLADQLARHGNEAQQQELLQKIFQKLVTE